MTTTDSRLLTPPYRVESKTELSSMDNAKALLPSPVHIGGVPIHPVGADGVLTWMKSTIATGGRGRVSYANAHNVLLAKEPGAYRTALQNSDIVFCDGFGVWGASRWLRTPLPERMTLPDWSEQLFTLASSEGWSLFFLGAENGIAQRAAIHLKSRYPRLTIHTHHGYFDVYNHENTEVLRQINAAQPTLLLVGMGPPRQDLWMQANHNHHQVPITMAVGCLFDYMAGTKQRGPHWMTSHGAEWLWRLIREPQRLWRRYVLGNPRFIWHVLKTQYARRDE